MSNFKRMTIHPVTKKIEDAEWIDDHFGRHRYGVRFPDGKVFTSFDVNAAEEFEERAAIMQSDGGLSREEAEKAAYDIVYSSQKPL